MAQNNVPALFDAFVSGVAELEATYGTAQAPARLELQVISNDEPQPSDIEPPELAEVSTPNPPSEPPNEPPEGSEGVAARTAGLNDRYRRSWPESDVEVRGFTHISPGLAEHGDIVEAEVRRAVADYVAFDEETDPDALRNYGAFDHEQVGRVMWSIECFADEACEIHSEAPEDPARSYRVLMIFLASECD